LVVRGFAAARISISRALRRVQLTIKTGARQVPPVAVKQNRKRFFFGNDYLRWNGEAVERWNARSEKNRSAMKPMRD